MVDELTIVRKRVSFSMVHEKRNKKREKRETMI
jgi:hypothetical protein